MKAIATKQPTNESVKQNKSGEKGRSRSVSPLSTGMPLLQRKCACGGGCPSCKEELGIQTKLKISEPGDKYEQEADRIADEVMRMPEPSLQRQVRLQKEDEEMVQSKVGDRVVPLDSNPESSEAPSIVHDVLNSPGQPLDPATRTFMESRFGHNFSTILIHKSPTAAALSRSLNAKAFTIANHIVFGEGEFQQESFAGQHLLAHELTHVVQQGMGVGVKNQQFPILQRKPLPSKDRQQRREERKARLRREGLLRFLQRVERRAQAGKRILSTRKRAQKAEQILCLVAQDDSEIGAISPEATHLLTELVEEVKGQPPRCTGEQVEQPISSEAETNEEEIDKDEEKNTEEKIEFPDCIEPESDRPISGKQLLIIANGYPGFKSAAEEIQQAKNDEWLPNTPDFNEATTKLKKDELFGVSTPSEFIGALEGAKGPIKRVIFIGHGFTDGIAFSGNTSGESTDYFGIADLPTWQPNIDKIKPKFAKGATIDLFACNLGAGIPLMEALAAAFCVCVRGFDGPIKWCLQWNERNKITSRGRYSPPNIKPEEENCEGTGWRVGFDIAPPKEFCPKWKKP